MEVIIAVSFLLVAFTAGFLSGNFSEKYRMRAMVSISRRVFDDAPCQVRLENALNTWKNLRQLFYSWRGGLSGSQYFAAVTLINEMDDRLEYDRHHETDKNEDNDDEDLLN